jgi:sigma-B regulation protein RsbU (phosphoserine phosphatase)
LQVHASAPLRSGDRILGILNVAGPDWSAFNAQALALLSNVGSQMGLALERARLYDLLQERHIQEQGSLLDVSNQLLRRLDLDDLTSYLVEEAQRLLRVDACALLLPTREPGYLSFRAATGWRTDPRESKRRVPINEQSGAGQVMRTQRPLLVEDIEKHDPTPWMSDWLKAEGFRGHAVVPLIAEDKPIGILAIDTREPRLLDESELRFLRLLANQAALAIETARLHREEIRQQRMEHELTLAQQIQLSLLPQSCPAYPGWELSTYYQAARRVSGDFYDFFEVPGEKGRLGMVIADVAGKGVPAALFMVHCRTMIRTSALSVESPAEALSRANELILSDNKSDIFVTAFYGILDTRTHRLEYTNAGHNRPLWLKAATGEFQELSARGIILGSFEEVELEEQRIDVAPSDLLVFYTDGVTEARNAAGELFSMERLKEAVASHREANAKEIIKGVVQAINTFAGDTPPSDDFTLLVVKRKP